MPIVLRPYQNDAVDDILYGWYQLNHKDMCAVLPTGAGKCLGVDTPVMMHDGAIKMVQDVVPGDLLMGPDSNPRYVMSTCKGQEMLYRVTPVKGSSYVVNESHILSLKMTGNKCNTYDSLGRCHKAGDTVNINVRDYLASSKTFKHCAKGWRTPIRFTGETADPYLPPYLLGLWIGDGTKRTASITTADVEIKNYLYQYAVETGQNIRPDNLNTGAATTYHFSAWYRKQDSLNSSLRDLGVLGVSKHIPFGYKTANDEQRLELLAGLLDSDGHYDGKSYDVVFKQEQLAEDLAFVARSLGLAAYVKECQKTCTNTGAVGTYHRISISGDFSRIPSRLKRNDFKPRKQVKSVLMTGIKVEPIGVGDYYGFEITGDRLFVLGDFTVTHNTVILSHIVSEFARNGKRVIVKAHRQELVGQISCALARMGIVHTFVAAASTIRFITNLHVMEFGRSFYSTTAGVCVASAQTLIRRDVANWASGVDLQIDDECHHVLRDNLWGKCHAKFPNAYGLGVTATPARADGKGLGRHADGVYDHMVLGPTMRELISMGNLCDYKIFVPPTDLVLSDSMVSKTTGEYQKEKLNVAVEKSSIVGDVVKNYLRICPGKLGITFTTSVEKSGEIAASFTAAGVPAVSLSAQNTDVERADAIRDFSNGKIRQLVNVGLFDEGFDVPGLEVVCDAQPTKSLPKFHQKFGRGLRTKQGKTHAIYIDFAQNIKYTTSDGRDIGNHWLPDTPQVWSLDRRESRGKSETDPNEVKLTRCTGELCFQPYPAHLPACPWCGHVPAKSARSGPEFVEGDLFELPADMLAQMRGEISRIDMDAAAAADAHHMPNGMARAGFMKNHRLRAEAQVALRAHISQWSGVMRNCVGFDDRSIYKAFYKQYGVDVLKAQTLGRPEAEALTARIAEILELNGISV